MQAGERQDTHVGPVLPERAPSEGPRSTAAVGPTWVPYLEETTSELGMALFIMGARSSSRAPPLQRKVESVERKHKPQWPRK